MSSKDENLLWSPSVAQKSSSNLFKYMDWLKIHESLDFTDYDALWQWSVSKPDDFWVSILHFFEVSYSGSYKKVRSQINMPGVQWFEGIKLNYAEHIFKSYTEDTPAVIYKSENQDTKELSWKKLKTAVSKVKNYLSSQGVEKGDRVIGYLPNGPEATIAFLATNAIGAVWSSASPDFGLDALVDRFAQIAPKVLIASVGYSYNGKWFDKTEVVESLTQSIPTITSTVWVSKEHNSNHSLANRDIYWGSLMSDIQATKLTFERVDFNEPIWVLYSSGTTGKPKAITHSQGGILLEHYKYMTFHQDVKRGEKCFWYTTTGWMMWNYIQSSLLVGGTMVLYDGSPVYPSLDILWSYVDEKEITHFGTSAGFLLSCEKVGQIPNTKYDFKNLRSIGSTGSTLPPESFDWVYQKVKNDLWLTSISGGTDVCSAFVGGNPLKTIRRGEIQSIALGCKLEVWNDKGAVVETGDIGEMVIAAPMPSMPIFFWGDISNQQYTSSYFETYNNVWRHGDWIKITDNNGVKILGRSDATLNRGGVRIGTSEIYSAIDDVSEVADSLVVCIEHQDGSFFMPLFVQLKEGESLSDNLVKKIKNRLRLKYTARHVPDKIIEVESIPYTISGKKLETPVKKVLMGSPVQEVVNLGTLRNPESLQIFEELSNNIINDRKGQ